LKSSSKLSTLKIKGSLSFFKGATGRIGLPEPMVDVARNRDVVVARGTGPARDAAAVVVDDDGTALAGATLDVVTADVVAYIEAFPFA